MEDYTRDNTLIKLDAQVILNVLLNMFEWTRKPSDYEIVPGLCAIQLDYFDLPVVHFSFVFLVIWILHSYSFVNLAPVVRVVVKRKFSLHNAADPKIDRMWWWWRRKCYDIAVLELQLHSQEPNAAELTLVFFVPQLKYSGNIHVVCKQWVV